jgi:hypothetical protein
LESGFPESEFRETNMATHFLFSLWVGISPFIGLICMYVKLKV